MDTFLATFGYTIDPNVDDRQYAHHTDLAHYFPGKRVQGFGDMRPTKDDIAHDREWFEREMAIIAPLVVVALGKEPAVEFTRRYLDLRFKRLSDVPVEPLDAQVMGLDTKFVAVHHPSGAFFHPSSKERYDKVAAAVERVLRT